jgi:hypothetical protein
MVQGSATLVLWMRGVAALAGGRGGEGQLVVGLASVPVTAMADEIASGTVCIISLVWGAAESVVVGVKHTQCRHTCAHTAAGDASGRLVVLPHPPAPSVLARGRANGSACEN